MKALAWAFLIILSLGVYGCAAIGVYQVAVDRVSDRLVDAVTEYCEDFSDAERSEAREKANALLDPHSVEVNCGE